MLDLIKIVNRGPNPIVLKHDGKGHVTIESGKARILTSDYAYLHFGDPHAVDAGKNKTRTVEFENARTTWGFYPGLMPEAAWEGRAFDPNTGTEIGPFKPQVECYDMDDNRVFMVIDDPDGSMTASLTGVPTLDQSDAIERNAMQQQMAAMAAQIQQLSAVVLAQQSGVPNAEAGVELAPSDQPYSVEQLREMLAAAEAAEEDEEEEPTAPQPKATKASKAAKAAAAQTAGQAERNEKRDEIPQPPADEPVVKKDAPRTTRIGGGK